MKLSPILFLGSSFVDAKKADKVVSKPYLNGDVRYTVESAEYWTSLGLTINPEDIYGDDGKAAYAGVQLWNNQPYTNAVGENRFKVDYYLDSSLTSSTHNLIRSSLALMSTELCLDFNQIDCNTIECNPDGIMSFFQSGGCWSYIGRLWSRVNEISIGRGCEWQSTIQHEVMHALGFHHEQVRPDRDQYVKVHFENIQSGMEGNFNKLTTSQWVDQDISYDIASVMQYSGYGFSTNGKPTITIIVDGVDTGMAVVDKADRSSSMDTWQLCKLYNCDKCAGHEISSYSGAAHSQYMHKCSDDFLRYYFHSRCRDGFRDCENGDDENESNALCSGTTTTATTTTKTTTTTTTTTTTKTTTTSEANVCDTLNIIQPTGKKYGLIKAKLPYPLGGISANTISVRYNFVSAKVWTKEYLGFLTFTQGVCGADFLKAISNGRVTFDAMDKQAVYDTADQHRHLGEKMVTIQFRHKQKGTIKSDYGNAKKDQVVVQFTGMDGVTFGNKNMMNCLQKAKVSMIKNGSQVAAHGKTNVASCINI